MICLDAVSVTGALHEVSFAIEPGTVVALVGHNGSGKSTLGRLISAGQLPDEGCVVVDEVSITSDESSRFHARRRVGYVGQVAANQTVSSLVMDEVAFGLRNIGVSSSEIPTRVNAALGGVGLAGFGARAVSSLSGGELERLVLASVLALEPSYLVLDEVSAQLDSARRRDLRSQVRALADKGLGIVLITHDPLEVLGCDVVIVLDEGRVRWSGTPSALLTCDRALWDETLPPSSYVDSVAFALESGFAIASGAAGSRSCEAEDVAAWAATGDRAIQEMLDAPLSLVFEHEASRAKISPDILVSIRHLYCSRNGSEVLNDVSLDISQGLTLVAGVSGAGKTTLACAIAGLIEPDSGSVSIAGAPPMPGLVSIAFQNPEDQLFCETVERELAFAAENYGYRVEEVARMVGDSAKRFRLEDLLDRDPFQLSGGQARRVALASIMSLDCAVSVFDEPTSGLDAPSRSALHHLLRERSREGAVLVVSHDLEEWIALADHVVLLAQGSLVWQGSPQELSGHREVFASAGLEPPEAWKLASSLRALARDVPEAARETGAVVADALDRKAEGLQEARMQPVRATQDAKPASVLATMDARIKMVLLLAATCAVFAARAPVVLAFWVAAALAILMPSGAGARCALKAMRPAIALLGFIVCANLVSCDGSAAITVAGPVGLNPAGALSAVTAIVRIFVLVTLALAVSQSTKPTELADGVTSLMRPLGRLRVPVAEIGLMLSMALRFIPLVSEEVERIRLAQTSRGVVFDHGSVVKRVRAWFAVLTPLVVGLFRRADRIAESMDARCFGMEGATEREHVPLCARDRVVLAAGLAAMAAACVLSYSIG